MNCYKCSKVITDSYKNKKDNKDYCWYCATCPEFVRTIVDPEKILEAYKKVRELKKFEKECLEHQPKPIELQKTYHDRYPIWKLVDGKWVDNDELYKAILKIEILNRIHIEP